MTKASRLGEDRAGEGEGTEGLALAEFRASRERKRSRRRTEKRKTNCPIYVGLHMARGRRAKIEIILY